MRNSQKRMSKLPYQEVEVPNLVHVHEQVVHVVRPVERVLRHGLESIVVEVKRRDVVPGAPTE